MIDSQGRSGPCKRRRRSRVILGDPNVNHVERFFLVLFYLDLGSVDLTSVAEYSFVRLIRP